jgi:hypothetical protein
MQNQRRVRSRISSNDNIEFIREIVYDYNENMNYYNSNMRRIIDMVEPVGNNIVNRNRNYRNNNNNNNNNINHNINHRNYTNPPPIQTTLFQMYEDVVIRPTSFQIQNAVEDFCFDPSGQYLNTNYRTLTNLETMNCPITMEIISPGHIVSRIRHCGHTFSYTALRNWFSINTRCPCCRFDIRETPITFQQTQQQSAQTTQTPSTSSTPSTQPIQSTFNEDEQMNILDRELNNLFNDGEQEPTVTSRNNTSNSNVWRNISNTLRTFIQRELQNNPTAAELLYTFDIPFIDISGNRF